MKKIALVLAALVAGCSTTPENRLGTDRTDADKLAVISPDSSEVKVLETDGKPLPGSGTSDFYIEPGAHTLQIKLNWCPGGQCTSFGAFAERPRLACIDAMAGTRYRISASNPGPDWVPRVTAQASGGGTKPIESNCK
jgi:hypothetical protein